MSERTRLFKRGERVLIVLNNMYPDEFEVIEDRGEWVVVKDIWNYVSTEHETFRIYEFRHTQIVSVVRQVPNPRYNPVHRNR